MTIIIETERLLLRTWKKEDAERYFQINQDSKVIELLPGALTMEQVVKFIDTVNVHQEIYGYTLWAAELKSTNELMGFMGLKHTNFSAHFIPAVEVGWRLGSKHWSKGYATEGAKASIDYGFHQFKLKEIVPVSANVFSIRVMWIKTRFMVN